MAGETRDTIYGETIHIQALKYGNRSHYEWDTTLLEKRETGLFVLAHKGRQLHHHTKGKVFTMENWAVEYFPFDEWFTASAEVVDGQIMQMYCNICQPPQMKEQLVSFIDLDIDLIFRNRTWEVVDEDEFELHTQRFGYPPDLIERVRSEVERLQERIEQKGFPFDGTFERLRMKLGEE